MRTTSGLELRRPARRPARRSRPRRRPRCRRAARRSRGARAGRRRGRRRAGRGCVAGSVTVAPSCGRCANGVAAASPGASALDCGRAAPGVSARPERQRATGGRRPGASAVVPSARLDGRSARPRRPRRLVLASGGPQPDRGERHPDLAEHLDRDEEAGEQEHDAQELADLEQLGGAGPVERVGDASGRTPRWR